MSDELKFKGGLKKAGFRLDAELLARFRVACGEKKVTLRAAIEWGMRKFIAEFSK